MTDAFITPQEDIALCQFDGELFHTPKGDELDAAEVIKTFDGYMAGFTDTGTVAFHRLPDAFNYLVKRAQTPEQREAVVSLGHDLLDDHYVEGEKTETNTVWFVMSDEPEAVYLKVTDALREAINRDM